jgi:uncharacterized protein (UPF0332 family)
MIKPFNYYVNNKLVKKVTINPGLARALITKAEVRLKRVTKVKITREESSIVFEDIYESVREALQSLMQLKGYKPYSHEALVAFVKEQEMFSLSVINDVDRYRILRNKSVYEAKQISLETCQEALAFATKVLPEVKKHLPSKKSMT